MADVRRLRPATTVSWAEAVDRFLAERDLAANSVRAYRITLARVGTHLSAGDLADLQPEQVAAALRAAYPAAAPASWNRHLATVRSFLAYATRQGWTRPDLAATVERRREPADHTRALSRADIDRLLTRKDIPVRDRCLWRMLYETAARAEEILRLNVEDLDLTRKRAVVRRKGGAIDTVHWQTGTARLLPYLIRGRTHGPVFLSSRPPAPGRAPATRDLDPDTGLARLSYRRAAEVFTAETGATLHQLRHSALTHLAEDGVPLPLLMAKSRHQSLRTLQRYVHPSEEAVAALTAEHDPARRR